MFRWRLVKDWSIRRKLWAGFGVVLVVLVVFGVYLFVALSWLQNSLVELEYKFDTLRQFSDLESDTGLLRSATQTYILTGDDKWEKVHDDASLRIDDILEDFHEVITNENDGRMLEEYEAVIRQLTGVELLIISRAKEGNIERAQELFDVNYEEQQAQAGLLLNRVETSERQEVAKTISNSNKLLRLLEVSFVVMVLGLVALTLLVSMAMTNELSDSINRVLAGAKAIAAGDLTRRVKVDSNDEVGRLARHFNVMSASLEEKVGQIQRREKRLKLQNVELGQMKDKLEEAVRHLKKLDEIKSEFVSIAAHQLRTPLTGIKWALHVLVEEKDKGKIDARQRKMVKEAFGATAYMLDLINNLLNVARMEEGKVALSLNEQSLMPLIREAIERFRTLAQGRGVKLRLKKLPPAESIPLMKIDEQRLRIVLDNLIDNALKYTPEGGVVTVDFKKEQKRVVVSIKDTGIGIPKDQAKRVFTKFYRSSNAQLVHTSGSGLGLYLSKRVVEQHGGEMWFDSREGKGTTFYFSLPVRTA